MMLLFVVVVMTSQNCKSRDLERLHIVSPKQKVVVIAVLQHASTHNQVGQLEITGRERESRL